MGIESPPPYGVKQLLESVVQQNGNLCEPTKRKMEGMGAQECSIDV